MFGIGIGIGFVHSHIATNASFVLVFGHAYGCAPGRLVVFSFLRHSYP